MALAAIYSGLRGTCGERSWVPPDPVTAQVINGFIFIARGMAYLLG
jgi:hypothetical protein